MKRGARFYSQAPRPINKACSEMFSRGWSPIVGETMEMMQISCKGKFR